MLHSSSSIALVLVHFFLLPLQYFILHVSLQNPQYQGTNPFLDLFHSPNFCALRGFQFPGEVVLCTPSLSMEGISVVSMNVNGLNVANKRRILFDYLRRSRAEIILLQETHATGETEKIWRQEWGGRAYFCNGSQSSKGVAIMVSRDFQVDVLDQRSDKSGRILCMDMKVKDTIFTIASIYAPTQDKSGEQLENLSTLENFLEDLTSTHIIAGGDFNCFLNPSLDRTSQHVTPPPPHGTVQSWPVLSNGELEPL